MKFPSFDSPITGTAVPLSALQSESSTGIGEYPDIVPFARWCKQTGIKLVQILPVNDTGSNPSPYSAISGYALHPIYLRLQDVPGADQFEEEVRALQHTHQPDERVRFREVLSGKMGLLKKIFTRNRKAIMENAELTTWTHDNPWIQPYAVFRGLKTYYDERSWKEWPKLQNPSKEDIDAYGEEFPGETAFYTWIQYHCEKQLSNSVRMLDEMGIALKGDLPILMQEDSTDVWYQRQNFIMELRAGAPPDMYSDTGQNWGFPIYNWRAIEEQGFAWWKQRLIQASKFYHAYRIDHVLGFFRIWAIPAYEEAGSMGYFRPSVYITEKDLTDAGFSKEQITWLSRPHIPTEEIYEVLGEKAEEVFPYLVKIGSEELFHIDKNIRGSNDIDSLPISTDGKQALNNWNRNRALMTVNDTVAEEDNPSQTMAEKKEGEIENEQKVYAPAWLFRDSRAFQSLNETEKEAFTRLVHRKGQESELLWEKRGKHLLSFMEGVTDMLICAEDLGVVPRCVPKVLNELGILGLKICFWEREYDKPEAPFIPLADYPELSVAMLSAHDTTPMRQWWEEQADNETKTAFLEALPGRPFQTDDQGSEVRQAGDQEVVEDAYTPKTAETVNKAFLFTGSRLCIFQLQELFAMDPKYRKQDPKEERINVPGTISPKNWSYRIPVSVEALSADKQFLSTVAGVIAQSRRQAK